ncbi:MAG: hypothetical protein IIT97_03385, partial [Mycoplasmataceae bacterium]|nr:hypothetical protein [Mycoplasmataceae bacterium]
MTKIRAVDLYKIIFNNLNFINETSLTHLYLPLIGAKAYKLYLWLRSELLLGINSTDSFEQNHNRILNYLKLDINEFNDLKQILEEYGLLKTYYDDVNNHYLYYLQKPLEIDQLHCFDYGWKHWLHIEGRRSAWARRPDPIRGSGDVL